MTFAVYLGNADCYKELEKMVGEKKLKSIGVSNYTIEDYEELKPHVTIKPVVNQVEINPFLFRKNTIQYFKAEGIVMHSYRTLRQGKEMSNEAITAISKKHSKTSAQILGRWCVQQEMVYIPKSEKKEVRHTAAACDHHSLNVTSYARARSTCLQLAVPLASYHACGVPIA